VGVGKGLVGWEIIGAGAEREEVSWGKRTRARRGRRIKRNRIDKIINNSQWTGVRIKCENEQEVGGN